MRNLKFVGLLFALSFLSACVSIPKETIVLSQTLGKDIAKLQESHINIINIYFDKIEKNINTFIDDIYAPYVIHYVLEKELEEYKNDNPSIYTSIFLAGEVGGKEATENAINDMFDFQDAARKQINNKWNELLNPIHKQRAELIKTINQSYKNTLYANSTITAYLQSIKKVKDSQKEALSLIGLEGADTFVAESLINASETVGDLVEKGREIDIKSDQAYNQIEEITRKIKEITQKKQ